MALYANRVAMPYTRFDNNPLWAHLAIASESFWFYFRKTLLPFSLSPLYEVPTRADLLEPRFLHPLNLMNILRLKQAAGSLTEADLVEIDGWLE